MTKKKLTSIHRIYFWAVIVSGILVLLLLDIYYVESDLRVLYPVIVSGIQHVKVFADSGCVT